MGGVWPLGSVQMEPLPLVQELCLPGGFSGDFWWRWNCLGVGFASRIAKGWGSHLRVDVDLVLQRLCLLQHFACLLHLLT